MLCEDHEGRLLTVIVGSRGEVPDDNLVEELEVGGND
jgi:hypothetical protein